MNIGIVGCGLIGAKRAGSIGPGDKVTLVCDTNRGAAERLARSIGADVANDVETLVNSLSIDAVVVATSHDVLASIAASTLRARKHVLIEKPAARNAGELRTVCELYHQVHKEYGVVAKVGFNHRFHPSFIKARQIVASDPIGDLMFIRGRYGHGGRVGYDKEWRAKPEISGGGEMVDQGVHLIDLSRSFMGEIEKVSGVTRRYFWSCPVEDNGFMLLESPTGQVAQLQVSWTEWKNLFSFEIYYRNAKLHVEGLGGSYGTERLSYYKMKPEMGPPETIVFEYPGKDSSWDEEWRDFKRTIALEQAAPLGTLDDALAALSVVGKIYEENSP
jgi:predicted dehydrogenase